MNDDRFDLASAYLDDAVTPAERARAEADPEVMALVAELRTLAGRMRDVEPPSDTARDRALTAALDVAAGAPILGEPGPLDPPHATDVAAATAPVAPVPPATDPPAPVVPIGQARRSSRSSRRVLAYAAAALALGAVGVVAANALSSTSGPQDDFAEAPTATIEALSDDGAADDAAPGAIDTSHDQEALQEEPADAVPVPPPAVTEVDGGDSEAPDVAGEEPAEPTLEAGAEPPPEDAGEGPGGSPTTTPATAVPGATPLVVELDVDLADLSQTELAGVAAAARAARDDGTAEDTTTLEPLPPACAARIDDVVAVAAYDGAEAWLGVTDQFVRVVDPLDCTVVSEVDRAPDD